MTEACFSFFTLKGLFYRMLLWCGLSYALSLNCSQQCPAIQFLSPAMGGRGKEGQSSACIHSDHWEQPGYLQGASTRDSFPAPHQGAALGPGLWKFHLEPTYPVHGDPPTRPEAYHEGSYSTELLLMSLSNPKLALNLDQTMDP